MFESYGPLGSLSDIGALEGDCGPSLLLLSLQTHDVSASSDICSHC